VYHCIGTSLENIVQIVEIVNAHDTGMQSLILIRKQVFGY